MLVQARSLRSGIVSILTVVATGLALVSNTAQAASQSSLQPTHPDSSYSCLSPHCYGNYYWNGSIAGVTTWIQVTQLTQPTGSSAYFIDHEEWMNGCSYGYACPWTEMGYSLGVNQGTTEAYFYGGYSGSQYYEYLIANTGGYGNNESQQMKYNSSGYTQFSMCGTSVCYSSQYLYYSFSPSSYTLGSELYGNAGGSSPVTTYQYEGFYSSYNGSVVWQQAQPGNDTQSPQRTSIITRPASGNHGGVFQISCGC